jgi:hypothetical protein
MSLAADVQRELERLIAETAAARTHLAHLREKLAAAREIIDSLRREGTPGRPAAQGEANADEVLHRHG